MHGPGDGGMKLKPGDHWLPPKLLRKKSGLNDFMAFASGILSVTSGLRDGSVVKKWGVQSLSVAGSRVRCSIEGARSSGRRVSGGDSGGVNAVP